MLNTKIIDYFFKQAEIGNWEEVQLLEAEKKMTNLSLINNIKNYGAGKSFEIGVYNILVFFEILKKGGL